MTSLLNTGKTALFAFQSALSTSSHNIANVNTEGYSRQRVDFDAQAPAIDSVSSTGGGVRVASIDRLTDEFATARVVSATSEHAQQEIQYELASRLDDFISTEGLSVAPALNNFFNSIQDANADPSSLATREVVLENADQLANRFSALQNQIDDIQSEVNDRTTEGVNLVDQYASSIAEINSQIVSSSGGQNTQQAHDLSDQRDQLVSKISEYISVCLLYTSPSPRDRG